jgi:hypothetical protein
VRNTFSATAIELAALSYKRQTVVGSSAFAPAWSIAGVIKFSGAPADSAFTKSTASILARGDRQNDVSTFRRGRPRRARPGAPRTSRRTRSALNAAAVSRQRRRQATGGYGVAGARPRRQSVGNPALVKPSAIRLTSSSRSNGSRLIWPAKV